MGHRLGLRYIFVVTEFIFMRFDLYFISSVNAPSVLENEEGRKNE